MNETDYRMMLRFLELARLRCAVGSTPASEVNSSGYVAGFFADHMTPAVRKAVERRVSYLENVTES